MTTSMGALAVLERAIDAAGAQEDYNLKVTGSNPVSPTVLNTPNRGRIIYTDVTDDNNPSIEHQIISSDW